MGVGPMTVTRTFAFENEPTVDDLQPQLQNTEVRLQLKSLTFRATQTRKFTRGVFERVPAEPALGDLRLVEDPTGALPPGDNEELVCRGTACIRLIDTKVVAFRKVATQATALLASPAPPAAPAPPSPPPPPSADGGA